jgi:hypothetical protein
MGPKNPGNVRIFTVGSIRPGRIPRSICKAISASISSENWLLFCNSRSRKNPASLKRPGCR